MAKTGIFINGNCKLINTNLVEIFFEETKKYFSENEMEREDIQEIFENLQTWLVVSGIDLDSLNKTSFNILYKNCIKAMKNYPYTPDGNNKPKDILENILSNWLDFINLLKTSNLYSSKDDTTPSP